MNVVPPRVVHLINSLAGIGGAERLILDISAYFPHRPVPVIAWYTRDNSLLEQDSAGVLELIALRPLRFSGLRKALRTLRQADVVHVHLFPSLYLGAVLPARILYTEHNTWNRRRDFAWLRPIEQLVYRRYNKIVAISDDTSAALSSWLRKDLPIAVIPNGINLQRFPRTPRRHTTAPFTIGMAARFALEKDHETLVRAMALLPIHYRLMLAGSGILRARMEQLVSNLEISDRVQFLGDVRNMQNFFDSIDLYVQSSNADGFSIVTVEAMASGLPSLVSDIDGLRDTVAHPELTFQPKSPARLAERIRLVLESPEMYRRLAEYAVDRSAAFDAKTCAAQYVRAYADVCAASSR